VIWLSLITHSTEIQSVEPVGLLGKRIASTCRGSPEMGCIRGIKTLEMARTDRGVTVFMRETEE